MLRRTALLAPLLFAMRANATAPVRVVTSLAHDADLVRQLGGERVQVTAAPIGPNQDPHGFEPGPSLGRALAAAQLVVMNGADYDPWMRRAISGTPVAGRAVLDKATLLRRGKTDNPHLWFDPRAIPTVARAITAALGAADPDGAAEFAQRLETVLNSLAPLDARVAALRARFAGTPVAATEPVFGLMTDAIGLQMRHERFQTAIMNETEPRPSDVAAFEADLRARRVRVLIVNTQTSGGSAARLVALARRSGVTLAPVQETMPPGMHFQDWLLGLLDGLERALAAP